MMKKPLTIIALLFFIASAYSQTTLSFCTHVQDNGYCAFDNNKFITTPDSTTGRIFMKINSTITLGTKLTYKIYKVDKNGEEKFSQLVDQSIQPDWMMAWEPYTFATNAKYTIKVFNDADKMICSKSFELIAGSK
jgi:hypothetical protein